MYTDITYIILSYRRTLYIEIAHTNYLAGSLNIYIGKTPVSNSSAPFIYLSVDRKPYYNSSLSLDKSIKLTSISL